MAVGIASNTNPLDPVLRRQTGGNYIKSTVIWAQRLDQVTADNENFPNSCTLDEGGQIVVEFFCRSHAPSGNMWNGLKTVTAELSCYIDSSCSTLAGNGVDVDAAVLG